MPGTKIENWNNFNPNTSPNPKLTLTNPKLTQTQALVHLDVTFRAAVCITPFTVINFLENELFIVNKENMIYSAMFILVEPERNGIRS